MAKYLQGMKVASNTRDLTGNRFGGLVAKKVGRDLQGKLVWTCVCDCGGEATTRVCNLTSGDTQSCGCLADESSSRKAFIAKYKTHGRSGTKEHRTWKRIKARCFNPNNPDYPVYSKIGMDEDLAKDFPSFIKEVGEIPATLSGRVSIDRVDNSEGYVKGNMRWATDAMQARNQGMYSNNKSGVKGVYKQGQPTETYYWIASWYPLVGRQKTRSFSVKKYGEELAFFMACEYREYQMVLLNLQGAGYSDQHLCKENNV